MRQEDAAEQTPIPRPLQSLPATPEKFLPLPRHISWSTVIGIVILVLFLILAGLYTWGAKLAKEDAVLQNAEVGIEAENTF